VRNAKENLTGKLEKNPLLEFSSMDNVLRGARTKGKVDGWKRFPKLARDDRKVKMARERWKRKGKIYMRGGGEALTCAEGFPGGTKTGRGLKVRKRRGIMTGSAEVCGFVSPGSAVLTLRSGVAWKRKLKGLGVIPSR